MACSGCGATVIWSKRPYHMANAGGIVSLVLLSAMEIFGWGDLLQPETLCLMAPSVLALGIMVIGVFTLRFELTQTANQALHATAAAPGS